MVRPESGATQLKPPPYQRRLGEVGPLKLSWFASSTVLYPERGGQGTLTEAINARPTGRQVKGLKGFSACEPFTLYYDGEHHSFKAGAKFGAHSTNEHMHTVK